MRKPRWIDARALILLHAESLAEHGGLSGLRDEAALHSAQHVLVTCDFDNIGSKKIIEYNGGKLEGQFKVEEQETPILRYWIGVE